MIETLFLYLLTLGIHFEPVLEVVKQTGELIPPEVWDIIYQVSVLITGLAAGGTFTVPAVRKLKELFGTNGGWTLVILGAFSTILTVAAMVVERQLAPGTIQPGTWGSVLLAIITQAHIRYRQLKDELDNTPTQ